MFAAIRMLKSFQQKCPVSGLFAFDSYKLLVVTPPLYFQHFRKVILTVNIWPIADLPALKPPWYSPSIFPKV